MPLCYERHLEMAVIKSQSSSFFCSEKRGLKKGGKMLKEEGVSERRPPIDAG